MFPSEPNGGNHHGRRRFPENKKRSVILSLLIDQPCRGEKRNEQEKATTQTASLCCPAEPHRTRRKAGPRFESENGCAPSYSETCIKRRCPLGCVVVGTEPRGMEGWEERGRKKRAFQHSPITISLGLFSPGASVAVRSDARDPLDSAGSATVLGGSTPGRTSVACDQTSGDIWLGLHFRYPSASLTRLGDSSLRSRWVFGFYS